jgi:hypothetical protein
MAATPRSVVPMHEEQLEELAELEPGWDSYGAPAPSAQAIDVARGFLLRLASLGQEASKAAPMADGGVELVLALKPLYASIEIFNDGDVVVGFSDREEHHETWDLPNGIEDLPKVVARLRELERG